MKRPSRLKLAIGVVATAALITGGASQAIGQGPTQVSGPSAGLVTNTNAGIHQRSLFATVTDAYVVPAAVGSGTWVNVPGMFRSFTIPAGERKHINVSFNAESQCVGGSWCSARVLVVSPGGVQTVLDPNGGTSFAFDSPDNGELWENQPMERNTRFLLGPGVHRVYIQVAKVGNVSTYRIGEAQMVVAVHQPG